MSGASPGSGILLDSILNILSQGWIGTAVGLVGFVLAIVFYLRSRRKGVVAVTEDIEREKILEELREISQELDGVTLPTLTRPATNTPDKELVIWAASLYAYSAVALLSELLESFLFLVKSGRIAGSHPIARFMMELAGHSCFVNREVTSNFRKRDYQAAWDHLAKINVGSSDIRRSRVQEGVRPVDLPPAPYAVGKFMDCLFEVKLPASEPKVSLKSLKTFYNNLSERSHPTYASLSAFCEMVPGRVRFRTPTRSQTDALLPEVSIAVTLAAVFISGLLKIVGESTVSGQLSRL